MPSNTPRLHFAVKIGDEPRVKQFITAGDNLNVVDEHGFTPLVLSVHSHHLGILQLLLDLGADTSVDDSFGQNALAHAAGIGNVDIVTALIRAGAEINAGIGNDHSTPLMLAAAGGHVGVVRLLIEEGCDVRKKAGSGTTALYPAASGGHINIVDILLNAGVDINETADKGDSVLAWAAQSGNHPIVVSLLERGADVSIAKSEGHTPLHLSARLGFVDITEVLLRAGADPNKRLHESGPMPLHLACAEGHVECVRLLLLNGANVSAVALPRGSTPLHYAIKRGEDSIEIIEILLSAGADLTTVDDDDNVPLTRAVCCGDTKAVSLLLEAGSDVNRLNKMGRNVLSDAVDLDVVKLLLAKGADATVVDMFGYTVLYSAVFNNASTGVICALFRAGADPTARSVDGDSPGDAARFLGHSETAKLLDLLEDKYRATRGNACDTVDYDDAKAAKLSVMAALVDKAKDIIHEREAKTGGGDPTNRGLTDDEMVNLLKSFNIDLDACEEVKEPVDECKDDQQSSSALPCLNCEAMTSRRCSGCGISYFCSKKCEMTARHLCCG